MLSVNLLAMTFVSKLLIIHSTIFFIVSFRVTSFQSYRLFHCELLPYFSFGTVQNTNFARKGKNREIFMPAKLSYLEIFHGTFSFDYCCSTIITLNIIHVVTKCDILSLSFHINLYTCLFYQQQDYHAMKYLSIIGPDCLVNSFVVNIAGNSGNLEALNQLQKDIFNETNGKN